MMVMKPATPKGYGQYYAPVAALVTNHLTDAYAQEIVNLQSSLLPYDHGQVLPAFPRALHYEQLCRYLYSICITKLFSKEILFQIIKNREDYESFRRQPHPTPLGRHEGRY
jgi:hypothetical protein